jgi:hypothetical protein
MSLGFRIAGNEKSARCKSTQSQEKPVHGRPSFRQ